MEYKYKPKLSDLIDRLSIDIMKSIFIYEHKNDYLEEIEDIMHDINILINENNIKFNAKMIHAILIIMLTNREIWLNESKARQGKGQNKLLPFTHSINGQRNNAKNIISRHIGDRLDLKIDCLAAEFKKEDFIKKHGDWELFK